MNNLPLNKPLPLDRGMDKSLADWKSRVIFELEKSGEFDVFARFVGLANELGYPKVAYGLQFPNSVVRPDYCYFSNFPDDWRTRFIPGETLHVGAKSAVGKRTVVDGDIGPASPHWTPEDFTREAVLHGVRFAWVQAIPGFSGTTSMVGLSGEDIFPNAKLSERMGALVDIVSMKMTSHLVPKFLPQSGEVITDFERKCLQWVLDGKTAHEIADIMNTKESSIRHLQVKLRTMFGKGSIFATAVLAYRMGMLTEGGDCLDADILGASAIMLGVGPGGC